MTLYREGSTAANDAAFYADGIAVLRQMLAAAARQGRAGVALRCRRDLEELEARREACHAQAQS